MLRLPLFEDIGRMLAFHGSPWPHLKNLKLTRTIRYGAPGMGWVNIEPNAIFFTTSKERAFDYAEDKTRALKKKKNINKEGLSPTVYQVEVSFDQMADFSSIKSAEEVMSKLGINNLMLELAYEPVDPNQPFYQRTRGKTLGELVGEKYLEAGEALWRLVDSQSIVKKLKDAGYDSIKFPKEEYCVFSSNQVRIIKTYKN